MSVLVYISLLLAVVYALLMIVYRVGWGRQVTFLIREDRTFNTRISVIVPARNEEDNIAACIRSILAQEYPADLMEVIVVDDHSTDATASVIKSFEGQGVRYLSLAEHLQQSEHINAYKKQALATGITNSTGELIITTDADCVMGTEWLKFIAAMYEDEQPVMIVAPVDFTNDNSVVQLFQSLDFMSMQGITVATLQMKLGNMSNGANLAFSRKAYEAVDGYTGIDHIASGDDYLLMMKLNKAYPGRISYLKARKTIVQTPPQPDWKGFLQQRIRWASKSGKYDDKKMTLVLSFVYLFNVYILLLALVSIVYPQCAVCLLAVLLVKVFFEFLYLVPVARFFRKTRQLIWFPIMQPLHIIYVVIAGFLGFFGGYSWKGRQVK